MNKDYRTWHTLKDELQKHQKEIFFKQRQIWWCSLGLNVGFEQDGKNIRFERPVLILKKFNKDLFWALPTTSQEKVGKYYYQFEHNGRKYSVILSQLRALSSKRLLRKIRKLPQDDFEKVRSLINDLV